MINTFTFFGLLALCSWWFGNAKHLATVHDSPSSSLPTKKALAVHLEHCVVAICKREDALCFSFCKQTQATHWVVPQKQFWPKSLDDKSEFPLLADGEQSRRSEYQGPCTSQTYNKQLKDHLRFAIDLVTLIRSRVTSLLASICSAHAIDRKASKTALKTIDVQLMRRWCHYDATNVLGESECSQASQSLKRN